MIAINMSMPDSCDRCLFKNVVSNTCMFSVEKDIPDIGKAEWCPLLRVEIAKRQGVYCEADIKLFGKERLVEKFSQDSAVAIGKLMLDNGAVVIVDDTSGFFDENVPPEYRQNRMLTALSFIVIPDAEKIKDRLQSNGSQQN